MPGDDDTNTLSVVVEIEGLKHVPLNQMVVIRQSCQTIDDAGFAFSQVKKILNSKQWVSPQKYFVEFVLQSFPRRQSEFWMQIQDVKGDTTIRLRVKNPLPRTFPIWPTWPLPQTVTNGHTTVTLKALSFETNSDGLCIVRQFAVTSTIPEFARTGPVIRNITDATGNVTYADFACMPTPSTNERAWKIHTQIARRTLARYADDELMILPNIPIPRAGEFLAIDQKTNISGADLNVTVVAGPGVFGLSNGVTRFMRPPPPVLLGHNAFLPSGSLDTWGWDTPFLLVEANGLPSSDSLRISATDQAGQVLEDMPLATAKIGNRRTAFFPFRPRPTSKSVTFRIVPTGPLTFDFMVNPQELISNQPATSRDR